MLITEAELKALNDGLCLTIPIMNLVNELQWNVLILPGNGSQIDIEIWETIQANSNCNTTQDQVKNETHQNQVLAPFVEDV